MAFPPTEPGLPARLADRGDTTAWERFVSLYRPAIVALARRRGLSAADADDVAQEVCRSVADAVGSFEQGMGLPGQARFSTWLATIADRKTIDALRRSRVRPASGHAFDEFAGPPYLVMPYCRGTTLEKRVRDAGPMSLREILRVGLQTARGLSKASSRTSTIHSRFLSPPTSSARPWHNRPRQRQHTTTKPHPKPSSHS